MKLSEKGSFAPPPQLPKHAQTVSEAIAAWPGVNARTHWQLGDETVVDGADFYYGTDPDSEELGHLHLEGEAHVSVPATVAKALISAGLAQRFQWGREIVVFPIERQADVAHALWLFQLSYDFLSKKASAQDLLDRVAARAQLSAER